MGRRTTIVMTVLCLCIFNNGNTEDVDNEITTIENNIETDNASNGDENTSEKLIDFFKNANSSVLEEVTSKNSVLTYEDKYIGNGKSKSSKGMVNTSRIIPANIDKSLTESIQNTSFVKMMWIILWIKSNKILRKG